MIGTHSHNTNAAMLTHTGVFVCRSARGSSLEFVDTVVMLSDLRPLRT